MNNILWYCIGIVLVIASGISPTLGNYRYASAITIRVRNCGYALAITDLRCQLRVYIGKCGYDTRNKTPPTALTRSGNGAVAAPISLAAARLTYPLLCLMLFYS